MSCEYKSLVDGTALRRIRRSLPVGSRVAQVFFDDNANVVGPRNRTGADKILVGVINYAPKSKTDKNHAIAVKFDRPNKVAYVFNPHGEDGIPSLEFGIAKVLFPDAGKVMRYDGLNLQKMDPVGVCVGHSGNFLTLTPELFQRRNKNSYIKNTVGAITQKSLELNLLRTPIEPEKRPRSINVNTPRTKIARIGSPMNINNNINRMNINNR